MKQCSNCRFFRQHVPDEQSSECLEEMGVGLCCRYAPSPRLAEDDMTVTEYTSWAQFPIVDDMMWCGDYEMRERQ